MNPLTRDTLLLSRPKSGASVSANPACAINCTEPHITLYPLSDRIMGLVQDSLAPNSRRAYAADLKRFLEWGGGVPSSDINIAEYLADHVDTHSTSSIVRWLTSLSKAHRALGVEDPTRSELVRSVLRGLRRRNGSKAKQAKPLLSKTLCEMLDFMGEGAKSIRDRAILLLGFAGGFRRSELVGLDYTDIEFVHAGIIVTIRKSKTDQFGIGRTIGIPYAKGRHCPVLALQQWLRCSDVIEGPLFRPINRYGHIRSLRLSGEAVSLIVRARLAAIGIEPTGYSGHSLRSGFATSAAQAGASFCKIRAQTGHTSDGMLARYIHNAELFANNPAGVIL